MDASERAAQLWVLLRLAAKNQQILTYDNVSKLIGVPRPGLGQLLEPIQSYCLVNNLPPLTILVVSKETGLPGAGFIAARDIPKKQMEVFHFDWNTAETPSPEALRMAVSKRPSNGIA